MGTDFIRFVMVGAVAAAANVGARLLFSTAMAYEAAVPLAYCVGMATAFTLNRLFVFKPAAAGGDWRGQLVRFVLVNMVALAQTFLVSLAFARMVFPAIGMTFHAELIAHAIGVASPILTSYWAHRHFTFATRRDPLTLAKSP